MGIKLFDIAGLSNDDVVVSGAGRTAKKGRGGKKGGKKGGKRGGKGKGRGPKGRTRGKGGAKAKAARRGRR